ncbi:hypothetical protein ACFTXL_09345 [Bacillus subtilis]
MAIPINHYEARWDKGMNNKNRPIEKNKIVIGEIGEMRKSFAINAADFKKGARVIDPAAHLFDEAHFFAHGNGRKNKESVLNNEEE